MYLWVSTRTLKIKAEMHLCVCVGGHETVKMESVRMRARVSTEHGVVRVYRCSGDTRIYSRPSVSVGPTALDSTNRGWEIHRKKIASGLNPYRLFFLVIIP